MLNFTYESLISRNFLLISDSLQAKIKDTCLVFAGCGLASVLAQMAARIGFTKFFLIDFDNVELSNLNRQAYYFSDIGKKKCDVLADKLLDINPEIQLVKFNEGINSETLIPHVIDSGDIIVNTIDFGELFFKLVHDSMQQNKLVVCPFNPGFGGLVVCFTKGSGSLYDLLNTDKVEYGLEFSRKLILNNLDIELPESIRANLDQLGTEILDKGYETQISIGVHMSSSMALTCIINFLAGMKIPVCPKIIYRSLYNL